jgi:hypothetical protein
MTENQINKIRESIKRRRAGLFAGKRQFGGFDDSVGARYAIADLYLKIADYQGALTYRKWFYKNFPDDWGVPELSLDWAVAFYATGKIEDCKICTIETAFQNVYLHGLMIGRSIAQIDKCESFNCEEIDYAQSIAENCKVLSTSQYIEWLAEFVNSDEYKAPVKEFIEINKLLKNENERDKRMDLINRVSNLRETIKSKN